MFARVLMRGKSVYDRRLTGQLFRLSSIGKPRVAHFSRIVDVSSNTRISDRLFIQAKDIGMQVTGHAFHAEMVDGTLCRRRFERFIIQDILYLEGCIKSFEIAQLRFSAQWDLFEMLIVDTRVELNKHKEYRECFVINRNSEKMNKACEAYIEFFMQLAKNGEVVEIIGALWPCYHLFLEMYHVYMKEMRLLTSDHPYYEHVKYYKELLVLPSVEAMKYAMDDILINANESEKIYLKKAFFRFFYHSLEHERRFFDAVYGLDKRVVNVPLVINSIISIREKLLEMPRGSWVFWDLDDTIWIPDIPLLRMVNNKIFEEYIFAKESEYPNIRELIWEFYYHCDYRLVEEEIIELFSDLKERGIHVLGLTKRETGYSTVSGFKNDLPRQDLTLRQLNKLGMSFSSIFPLCEILLKQEVGTNFASLKNGVAFCSHFDKGPILKILLNTARQLGIQLPPQIALIDDLSENILNVEEIFERDRESRIPVLAVQYRGADSLSDAELINYEAFTCLIESLSAA